MFQERRRAPGRAVAAVAALGIGLGGAVVLAPSAGAAPVTWTTTCTNPLFPDIPDMDVEVDVSVAPAKPVYTVGDEVDLTWTWTTPPVVPPSAPIALPADSTQAVADLVVSGAQTGTTVFTGPREHPEAGPGEPLELPPMTTKLVLGAAGTVDLTPDKFVQSTMVGTLEAVTTCVPAEGTNVGVVESLTVEAPGTEEPTLTSPTGSVLAGTPVELQGANWPAGTPSVSLCAEDGTECDPEGISASTLQVDDGNLSGSATIAAGTPAGGYAFRVTSGEVSLIAAVTVDDDATQPPATVTVNPPSGAVGSTATLNGSGFPPDGQVTLSTLPSGPDATITADADGNFTHEVTIGEGTTGFRLTAGDEVVEVPFTVTPPPGGDPNALSMTQAGTGIDFGSGTNGEVQELDAALNRITVVDERGGNLGWSLSATMSDLTADNGVDAIPAGSVAWTPECAAADPDASPVVTGSPGPLGPTAATLCAQNADTTQVTGGTFTADAAMVLTTPEFGAVGTYTGTLTLTLS